MPTVGLCHAKQQSGQMPLARHAQSSQQLVCNEVTHVASVSITETYGGMTMRATTQSPRTSQEPISNPLKDKRAITREVASALKQDFRHRPSHLKVIARHAEASPRTVEAWTDELSLPGLEYFLRLVPHSPSIQKLVLRLMTLSPDSDPEYFRALQDLRRAIG
jgi:hypothetical protein